jgi:signal transduction histidine kinase
MSTDPVVRFERLPSGWRSPLPEPRRADPDRLQREIRSVSQSPVVTAVLEIADAVLLVLNRERQIVAFNSRVAAVASPGDVLGRRPGEAFGCVNAAGPGGCGASPSCTTCGQLGAVLAAQERARPIESECVVRTAGAAGKTLEFNVRATPVLVEQTRFTVVSLRDISSEKRREVLEQVFFHDLLNTVAGLRGWAERLQRPGADLPRVSGRIDFLSRQVEREIRDHRTLLLAESGQLVAEKTPVQAGSLLHDVALVFSGHPSARDRRLELGLSADDLELVTDRSLLLRVLVNMVRNAFEATTAGKVVRLSCERVGRTARFLVHNDEVIDPHVQGRIFQRSFSTKAQRGRGLGTYSMKLFGERYLDGEVSFTSTPGAGTVFSIALPWSPLRLAS